MSTSLTEAQEAGPVQLGGWGRGMDEPYVTQSHALGCGGQAARQVEKGLKVDLGCAVGAEGGCSTSVYLLQPWGVHSPSPEHPHPACSHLKLSSCTSKGSHDGWWHLDT